MTADDRREHLTARGYHVCRDAVVGGPVPVWYWCRCGLDRVDRGSPRNRGYIDVVTGRWRWNHYNLGPALAAIQENASCRANIKRS